MKTLFSLLPLLFFSWISYGQPVSRELVSVRGHYRSLEQFSKTPSTPHHTVDDLRFPFDSATAAKRLSLKPVYLIDVRPESFVLPDPPANSSAQTRAELDYLLSLPTFFHYSVTGQNLTLKQV